MFWVGFIGNLVFVTWFFIIFLNILLNFQRALCLTLKICILNVIRYVSLFLRKIIAHLINRLKILKEVASLNFWIYSMLFQGIFSILNISIPYYYIFKILLYMILCTLEDYNIEIFRCIITTRLQMND